MKKFVTALFVFGLSFATCFSLGSRNLEKVQAESENKISIECNDSFVENQSYKAYVNLRTYEQISALSIEVHFDEDVLSISSSYNMISATMYDYSIHDSYISYSYIFDSVDTEYSQGLFYFYFSIKNNVTEGNYFFDVIVNEAYDSSLNNVDITSIRKSFTVSKSASIKTAHASLYSYSTNTSFNQEFSLSYYTYSYEQSSGAFVISYDDELFEFISLTKGNFFDNMIFDYNANTSGAIYISFAAISQPTNRNLFTITFRTIANITTSSEIKLQAPELYDLDMNPMKLTANSFTANISYDSSYEMHPAMRTNYSIDENNKIVSLNITLEADSHLGAGDFVLNFNKELLTFISYTKNFNPTFFTVNHSEKQLAKGQIKFSILSTTDIVNTENIVTFVFGYQESHYNQNIVFSLNGDGLTDSKTEPIELNFYGVSFSIPGVDFIIKWSKEYLYMDDPSFTGSGSGLCLSEGLYYIAKSELLKLDEEIIRDFKNNKDGKYTNELARYEAWAKACGDFSPFENNGSAANTSSISKNDNGGELFLLITVIAISSLSLLAMIIRTKKSI